MYLGERRIRSAGRLSGSIEMTLPSQLRDLQGVECLVVVREGPRPEIVLQPDLSNVHALYRELWRKLRLGLGAIDDIHEFSLADFTATVFPSGHWQDRPPLAYVEAFAILNRVEDGEGRTAECLSRILAYLAVGAALRLGLTGELALAFGDAVVYLVTDRSPGFGTDFERGKALQIFGEGGRSLARSEPPMEDRVWEQARPRLLRVYEQFHAWQEDAATYTADRTRWYRALRVETGGHVSSVKEYLRTVSASPAGDA